MGATALVIQDVLDKFRTEYGPQHWWPARSRYEVMVGAVLTQNTAWTNVEYALANLKQARVLSAEKIIALNPDRLGELIRPAGFFNLKTRRLRALSQWLLDSGGFTRLHTVQTGVLRKSLLDVHGIGPETADAILLYALERPVFVVDAYTRRIFKRIGIIQGEEHYEVVRGVFERELNSSAQDYNEYHALIVKHAKEVCLKVPRCDKCCLQKRCLNGGQYTF